MKFDNNQQAEQTWKFVNNTNSCIFLTGKAGTGKTTLLREIVQKTHKSVIIAAPTGIAALHAGGVTIHSLLQLPLGSFLPDQSIPIPNNINFEITYCTQIPSKIKLNTAKRSLIQAADLLIIDEVSMLRADLLDAIDTVLRYLKKNKSTPFGGMQILFIGDMLQLPPIVKDDEWNVLRQCYKSMYFFDALVFNQQKPIIIELEKIYRQTDNTFVSILNNLRNNILNNSDIDTLNKYYNQSITCAEGYIYLTTHNRKADEINTSELRKIDSPILTYQAALKGDFPEQIYPVESNLQLKVGAQIMFLKNDYSSENKYFNGKIGIVHSLNNDELLVEFPETKEVISVEKYSWENKRFSLNKASGQIDEETVGVFTQYPIKLAWAITIHKSQGLTFKKAIIDINDAFAPGQIYVALSRLESIEGLVLTNKIHSNIPQQNQRLLQFTNRKFNTEELTELLQLESFEYLKSFTIQSFNLQSEIQEFNYYILSLNKEENRSKKQSFKADLENILKNIKQISEVSDKFIKQLEYLFYTKSDIKTIKERIDASIDYFEPKFNSASEDFFTIINQSTSIVGTKSFIQDLKHIESIFFNKLQKIKKIRLIFKAFETNTEVKKSDLITKEVLLKRIEQDNVTSKKKKSKNLNKGLEKDKAKVHDEKQLHTREITFELYTQGNTIEQIAKLRSLSQNTIETHLAYFVAECVLEIDAFVTHEDIDTITNAVKKVGTQSLKAIKENANDTITYTEIKFVLAHLEAINQL